VGDESTGINQRSGRMDEKENEKRIRKREIIDGERTRER